MNPSEEPDFSPETFDYFDNSNEYLGAGDEDVSEVQHEVVEQVDRVLPLLLLAIDHVTHKVPGRRMNMVATVKDGEGYLVMFDKQSHEKAREAVMDFAHDPELSFDQDSAMHLLNGIYRSEENNLG